MLGKADVAEQFRNLNAGALDISYEQSESSGGFSFGGGSGGFGIGMSRSNGKWGFGAQTRHYGGSLNEPTPWADATDLASDDRTLDLVFKRADKAMYSDKKRIKEALGSYR